MTRGQHISIRWIAVTAMGALLFAGSSCMSPEAAREQGYMTHKNWWNFYTRGVQRIEAGQFQGAIEDLETALGVRSGAKFGYAEDQWRVRTYGMHFIPEYFPHRELGVALHEAGRTEDAIQMLQESIEQTPSGRAKHFLNLANTAKLSGTATQPPEIYVDGGRRQLTNQRLYPLTGTVSADGHVASFNVNREDAFIELAEPIYPIKTEVQLTRGSNKVTVEAADLLGRKTSSDLELILDLDAPRLVVADYTPSGTGYTLSLKARDAHGLQSVTADGQTLFMHDEGSVEQTSFSFSTELAAGPSLVEVTDIAGNVLQATLEPGQFALLDRPVYRDIAQAGDAQAVPALTDQLKPALKLFSGKGPLTVFNQDFFLDGSAEDSGGLVYISVNGENLLDQEDAGAKKTYFSRTLPLEEGTNLFTISCSDQAGNIVTREIVVIQKEPEFLDESYRLSVGIPPLTGENQAEVYTFQSRRILEQSILEEPVRFRLLERDEGWDFILREQQLSMSDLSDPRSALRIGKMLPAEMLLMGNIIMHGDSLTVYLKIVESSNGEVLFVEDVYCDTPNQDLQYQLNGLAMKVEQRFPLLDGTVTAIKDGNVMLDFGSDSGARAGMEFLVADGSDDFQLLRMAGDQPVKLLIKRARKDKSIAVITTDAEGEAPREGDLVYAR